MDTNLIDILKTIEDFRSPRGVRYPLWLILLLAILGALSGAKGYQSLEDFCIRHYSALCECLGVSTKRLPCDSTFRQVFQKLDFARLTKAFHQWTMSGSQQIEGEWFAVDGKSLGSTVTHATESYQNFVSLVSVYSHQRGVVVALQQFENKATSEITVVRTLLESLTLKDAVFTFDALHCQKKH